MRDIFETSGPEPIETFLFMNSFYDTDDAASFVDSYRVRLMEGVEHAKALEEVVILYGLDIDEFISLISKNQSPELPSS